MKLGAVKKGSTGVMLDIRLMDPTGAAKTGLTANSGLTAAFKRNIDGFMTPIPLVSMTAGTYAAGGFVEVDNVLAPGFYQFCPPDACWADTTGTARSVAMIIKGAPIADCLIEIALGVIDPPSYPAGILSATVGASPTQTSIPAIWGETGVAPAGIAGRMVYFISGALYGQAQPINAESNNILSTNAFSAAPQAGDQFIVA